MPQFPSLNITALANTRNDLIGKMCGNEMKAIPFIPFGRSFISFEASMFIFMSISIFILGAARAIVARVGRSTLMMLKRIVILELLRFTVSEYLCIRKIWVDKASRANMIEDTKQ